jgi:2-polyprenyl-6-methoxyphenol hydroxylase-like FAD-dependent oxidoreductase
LRKGFSARAHICRAQYGGLGAQDWGRRVEATLRHADGRQETVLADWLAGCDGAHSIVRHTLAAPFSGETMGGDWILADVH